MVNQHYYTRYEKFIGSLRNQAVDGYSEVHHVVPVSMGGSNDKDNLVALTARQHYVAHWMLAKACGGSAARAFFMMSNFGKYGTVNSTTYDKARKEYAKQVSLQMKEQPNVPEFTEEHREKLRQAKLGTKLTDEHKAKVGQAQIGRKLSEETKRKISEAKKGIATRGSGWSHSEETKMKMKQSQQFKQDVLEGAELQDSDGNVMTQEEADAFIATLP
jgi:hypothetical protein